MNFTSFKSFFIKFTYFISYLKKLKSFKSFFMTFTSFKSQAKKFDLYASSLE